MKLAVIGSRGLYVEIEAYLPKETTVIISGVAKGIDMLAEEYADKNGIAKLIFLPEYERFGKARLSYEIKKLLKRLTLSLLFGMENIEELNLRLSMQEKEKSR